MDLQVSPDARFLTVDGDIGLEEEEGRKLSRNNILSKSTTILDLLMKDSGYHDE